MYLYIVDDSLQRVHKWLILLVFILAVTAPSAWWGGGVRVKQKCHGENNAWDTKGSIHFKDWVYTLHWHMHQQEYIHSICSDTSHPLNHSTTRPYVHCPYPECVAWLGFVIKADVAHKQFTTGAVYPECRDKPGVGCRQIWPEQTTNRNQFHRPWNTIFTCSRREVSYFIKFFSDGQIRIFWNFLFTKQCGPAKMESKLSVHSISGE